MVHNTEQNPNLDYAEVARALTALKISTAAAVFPQKKHIKLSSKKRARPEIGSIIINNISFQIFFIQSNFNNNKKYFQSDY